MTETGGGEDAENLGRLAERIVQEPNYDERAVNKEAKASRRRRRVGGGEMP